jgi:protein disulfide-isomerase A6
VRSRASVRDEILIATVDATESKQLGERFGITGFPTIKFFPKGSTTAQDYDGGRTADTIVSWVNKKIGMCHRYTVGGGS